MTFFVEDEIASQPVCWRTAAEMAPTLAGTLPGPGLRVAFVGCGTSWFVGQALAVLRESAGLGESDAFTASEMPERPYDVVVALSRSGTTTEVVDLLGRLRGRARTVAVLGDPTTPVAGLADAVVDLSFADERSVVQTRFATATLALFRTAFGHDLSAAVDQARDALAAELPVGAVAAEQVTFVGQGWTVGLAHEAALKLREASAGWAESYPAMDYRHGPIAIAGPGRLVWSFGPPPPGLAEQVLATGATFVCHDRDPLAELVVAQRVAVARAVALGLNPDQPRHLTRSVVLTG